MPPNADEIRAELDRILASDGFAHAERLSRFLRYIVERTLAGEGDRLKEYAIGVEVFDRDGQYDPRLDSIVRVEAGRLRAKVEEYYRGDGRDDVVIIRLQRGGYAPRFETREPALASPLAPHEDDAKSSPGGKPRGWRVWLGVAAAVVLLVALVAWRSGFWESRSASTPRLTIAVLPFAHHSTDEADQLLAERITDGVTSELARLGTLGVVSHTTALQIAGRRQSLREIAQALKADLVMEATLTRDGDRVRVAVRLIDGSIDRKFWVEDIIGTVTDLPELQRRIASAAAAAAAKPRGR